MSGSLVLVATPIGNLGDITQRAVRELAGADVIACEDTRRTRALLSHLGIPCPELIVVNDHTEATAARAIRKRLAQGSRIAVITDAGTPGISDPGERLVRAAVDDGVRVEIAPGPSAAIAALVVSGLPAGRFVFEGFLPRKGSARTARLAALVREPRTAVLYEAPHRIRATLGDLAGALGGERRLVIVRELSKLHEEIWRGTLDQALLWAVKEPAGEIAIVLDGAPEPDGPDDAQIVAALRGELAAGVSKRDAIAKVVGDLDVAKRRVYALALNL